MNAYDLECAFLRTVARSRKVCQREASREIGCSLWHLNRVLHGHRQSLTLLRKFLAWADLKGGQP